MKARLASKGSLDPQLNDIVTASAIASALSHRMLASYAVNRWYNIVSYDISQAFLQGAMLKDIQGRWENKRKVYFDPPADAWSILYEVARTVPNIGVEARTSKKAVRPYSVSRVFGSAVACARENHGLLQTRGNMRNSLFPGTAHIHHTKSPHC